MNHALPLRSTRSALRRLADDPVGQLVHHGNWKSALLGSLRRGPVFAALAARRGWLPGTAEILLQAATAGFPDGESLAVFRLWFEAGSVVPLRIDYQQRPILRLSFVRDAQVARPLLK